MEASCVTAAPVFTLVTLARTRALAGEQTLGPLTQKQLLLFEFFIARFSFIKYNIRSQKMQIYI